MPPARFLQGQKPGLIMRIRKLHNWDVPPTQAVKLQKDLAGQVEITHLPHQPSLVAGLDCAFSKTGQRIIAAAVLLELPSMRLIETATAVEKVNYPYIPGLLSFREAPACLKAASRLKTTPHVFIVDGQGIAHPRRLGLAAHLGLFIDTPTIGCAKSRLIGRYSEPGNQKGAHSTLKDKNQIIGEVLRTRTNVKPVFVSVGSKCRLKEAVQIVLACAVKYRLPEPTRLADKLVSKLRQTL